MLTTNPNFDAANAQPAKRPLYIVWIEGLAEPITSFRLEDVNVTQGGYGMAGYGLTGYAY